MTIAEDRKTYDRLMAERAAAREGSKKKKAAEIERKLAAIKTWEHEPSDIATATRLLKHQVEPHTHGWQLEFDKHAFDEAPMYTERRLRRATLGSTAATAAAYAARLLSIANDTNQRILEELTGGGGRLAGFGDTGQAIFQRSLYFGARFVREARAIAEWLLDQQAHYPTPDELGRYAEALKQYPELSEVPK